MGVIEPVHTVLEVQKSACEASLTVDTYTHSRHERM
jgi:hypothetical protein